MRPARKQQEARSQSDRAFLCLRQRVRQRVSVDRGRPGLTNRRWRSKQVKDFLVLNRDVVRIELQRNRHITMSENLGDFHNAYPGLKCETRKTVPKIMRTDPVERLTGHHDSLERLKYL